MHSFIFKKKNTAHFFFKLSSNLASAKPDEKMRKKIKLNML